MNITIELVNHLKGLARGDVQPFSNKWGICYDLTHLYGLEDYRDLHPYFVKWPKYSGDIEFPVPSTSESISSRDVYYNVINLWENTENGDLRRELCLFLALEFKKEINH